MMLTNKELRNFIKRAYKCACNHGFHDEKLSYSHMAMLVVRELSEAVEADRHNRHAQRDVYEDFAKEMGDKTLLFERYIKDTVEDELADAVIRLCDMSGALELEDVLDMECEQVQFLKCGFKKEFKFTEIMYGLTTVVADPHIPKLTKQPLMQKAAMSACIETAIVYINVWCEQMGVDLAWHVNEKINYNESRPKKHGKSY